ncbi:MAG: hypothetical protein HQL01_07765 [Nitrospirae bacterium]|nr:hypothetical protein [Nitrospirota bacterium]
MIVPGAPLEHNCAVRNRLYLLCFVSIVLAAVILRMYKAYYTGVIYDEALTYFRFARDLNSAVSDYSAPNNHLLNSILIFFSVKAFGQSGTLLGVPAIRIPAVFFGIVYVISVALTIWLTLTNRMARIIVLALCLFNYYVFDLSILARGYAIALGAVYLELLLIVLYLTRLKDKNKTMVFLFSVLNFTALGAMLTSLYTIVPLNLALLAVVYYSERAVHVKQPGHTEIKSKPFKKTFEVGCAILWFSSLTLALLYKSTIKSAIYYSGKSAELSESPGSILKSLIADCMLRRELYEHTLPIAAALVLLILSVLFVINIIIGKSVSNTALIICSVLSGSILLAYILSTLTRTPMGYTRNHVFWLPLIFLCIGVVADGALALFNLRNVSPIIHKAGKYSLYLIIILISVALIAAMAPSLHAVNISDWKAQSVVGPLARQLKKTAPLRHWKIGFSEELPYNLYPCQFYMNEVYEIKNSNVAVYHISEHKQSGVRPYEYELFREFDCLVVVLEQWPQK